MTVPSRAFRVAEANSTPAVASAGLKKSKPGSLTAQALGVREDRSELWRIMRRFGLRRSLAPGALLFSSGDRARHLFFVESGLLDVFRPDEPEGPPVASFYPGACFTFDFGGFHVGSCEAREPSNVIGLPLDRLQELSKTETGLHLLLRQSHAFELKSFLEACQPGATLAARPARRERAVPSGLVEAGLRGGAPGGELTRFR